MPDTARRERSAAASPGEQPARASRLLLAVVSSLKLKTLQEYIAVGGNPDAVVYLNGETGKPGSKWAVREADTRGAAQKMTLLAVFCQKKCPAHIKALLDAGERVSSVLCSIALVVADC